MREVCHRPQSAKRYASEAQYGIHGGGSIVVEFQRWEVAAAVAEMSLMKATSLDMICILSKKIIHKAMLKMLLLSISLLPPTVQSSPPYHVLFVLDESGGIQCSFIPDAPILIHLLHFRLLPPSWVGRCRRGCSNNLFNAPLEPRQTFP